MTKFEVHSDSSDSIYTVTLENGVYNCSCPWGIHHEPGKCSCFKVCSGKPSIHHCKHIKELTAKTVFVDVEDNLSILTKLFFADVMIQLNEFFYNHQYDERFEDVFRDADMVTNAMLEASPLMQSCFTNKYNHQLDIYI